MKEKKSFNGNVYYSERVVLELKKACQEASDYFARFGDVPIDDFDDDGEPITPLILDPAQKVYMQLYRALVSLEEAGEG